MLSKEEAKLVLETCLETGGDFAEIFLEDTVQNDLELSGGKITKSNTSLIHGAGLRILRDDQEVYGYTNDTSLQGLLTLANSLKTGFNYEKLNISFDLEEVDLPNNHLAVINPLSLSNVDKIKYLQTVYETAKNYHESITQVIATIWEHNQIVTIYNTEGRIAKDERHHVRLALNVVASKPGVMQTAHDSIGGNCGYELFDQRDLVAFAQDVAQSAVTMLEAEEMVGQMLPVVIHNGFGGVILHEACGHALEATSVAKGLSVFCGKLGEQIASPIVTAVDDGTLPNYWGSANIDDEGTPTRRNVLIENGILKSYLVDKRNARKMKCEITGSARRQSYRFSPTSRMTNTFFVNGNSTFEEIIKNTEYGFFAKRMGGGSVNPATGEFNFAVNEGYMIENGKITRPVRGATLVGNGADILKQIDMIANNLSTGHGMCGSLSGSIPADVGQPTIRVKKMTVGGRGGKK